MNHPQQLIDFLNDNAGIAFGDKVFALLDKGKRIREYIEEGQLTDHNAVRFLMEKMEAFLLNSSQV